MTRTTLLLPLAASLMLGTAAFAQTTPQPPAQPMATPDQNSATTANSPQMSEHGQDPRQNRSGGMPVDRATTVNGIEAACTGVSDGTEAADQWKAYPVKIVVSGTQHQYFAGETVSITGQGGQQVAQMTCNAPWVLMKLQPGAYHATVDLPGHGAKSVAFTAPSSGQREVNVIYNGAQETSDQTSGNNPHRATQSSYQQPQSKPQSNPMDDNSTVGNGAVDQKPQQPQ